MSLGSYQYDQNCPCSQLETGIATKINKLLFPLPFFTISRDFSRRSLPYFLSLSMNILSFFTVKYLIKSDLSHRSSGNEDLKFVQN